MSEHADGRSSSDLDGVIIRPLRRARSTWWVARRPCRGIAVLVFLIVGTLTGCTANPGSVTSAMQDVGQGQHLSVEFTSALNLPEGAHVMFNGVRAGSVSDVRLEGQLVRVQIVVHDNLRIPADVRASIRQDTVLGDPYVSLSATNSDDTTAPLPRGGTIPTSQTSAPPPLEDTLAVLANFTNGGSIHDIQETIRKVNGALPSPADTTSVARIATIDINNLAQNTVTIDQMLDGLNHTAEAIVPRIDELQKVFSAGGLHYWHKLTGVTGNLGIIIPSIGSVFEGGFWLVPMLRQIYGSISTVRGGIAAVASNQQLIQQFLTTKLFPFIRKPSMQVVSASSGDGQNVMKSLETVLRMTGAVR